MARWFLAMLLAAGAPAALAAGSDDPLLFYASFEKGALAEQAVGGGAPVFLNAAKTAPGRVGNCIMVPTGAQLIYDGPGNAYAAAGTVSFFWRPDADPKGKSFRILDLSPLERVNYARLFQFSFGGDTVGLYATLGHWRKWGMNVPALKESFKPNAWRHFAIAWDQTRGAAIYVDGKLAVDVKHEWVFEGNVNQIGLGIETAPDFRPGAATFDQSFDELRVYDHWLTDAEIAALARGAEVKPPAAYLKPLLDLRRKYYSWLMLDGMPELSVTPDAPGIGLKQVGIASAADVKRSSWRTFDGERGRRWPGGVGYTDGGRQLNIGLCPNQSFDVLQLFESGPISVVTLDGAPKTILDVPARDLGHVRAVLAAPVAVEKMAITRAVRDGGLVYQFNLFKRGAFDPNAAAGAGGWQTLALRPAGPDDESVPEILTIRRTFYTADHETLLAAETPADGSFSFPAMRAVHVLGPEHADRQGLAAVALDLDVVSCPPASALRLDVIDPLNAVRYAVTADVQLAVPGPGRLRLMLDLRDLVLRPGARPRIALTFRDDVEINAKTSRVAWRWISVAEALPEFSPDQLARGRDIFQELSEPRPWGTAPGRLRAYDQLTNTIDELHLLQPEDAVVSSYWHWIHPNEQKAHVKLPEVPKGTPPWAVYLDAAIPRLKEMPYWWIDHRENGHGEFGANDGINDDTDLVGDWWALYLMRGPDAKLYESLRRTADISWKVTMQETGLGHFTDALHTYEDGMNAQCYMAMMAYGNPVYFERLFASARHYKELLGLNAAGHLHFRGSYYGLDGKGGTELDPVNHGWDKGGNVLALQPGMLIAWYNGNAYCSKLVKDWTDVMMAHSLALAEKNKHVAGVAVNVATDEASSSRFLDSFADAPWFCYELTGDRKYLDFLGKAMQNEAGIYAHVRETSTVVDRVIPVLGDFGLKDRFIAETKNPRFWKSSLHDDYYYELDDFFFAWLVSGDLNCINEGTKLTLNDITGSLPMLTVGEQSTDRVWLPQRLVDHIALGGIALLRGELYPKFGASWENASGRFAPFVKSQDKKGLDVWVCNLEEKPLTVTLRLWRLEHGRYEVRQGADQNQDGQFDAAPAAQEIELARFGTLDLTVPPRTLWFVQCAQKQPLDDLKARPDLAVCAEDARFDPAGGMLAFVVHNIGAQPTGPFTVRVTSGGRTLLEHKLMPPLEAPLDLNPRTVRLSVSAGSADGKTPVVIELDPENAIPEITEANNRLTVVPADLPAPEKPAPPKPAAR